MAFATCKYDRELQFMWSKVKYLNSQLEALDEMKGDEEEAKLILEKRKEIEKEIEFLTERFTEIELTYVESGMEEYLKELKLKASGPPPAPEYACPAPKAAPAEETESGRETVGSITKEISELELKLIEARLSGNASEEAKLTMAVSALRSRRDDIVETMKADNMKESEVTDDVRRDVESLRIQTSELRNEIVGIKDVLSRIAEKLGIDDQE